MDLAAEPVWTDASKKFEDLALSRLRDNVDELLKQKEAEEQVSILGPVVEKYNDEIPLLYGYAAALQSIDPRSAGESDYCPRSRNRWRTAG